MRCVIIVRMMVFATFTNLSHSEIPLEFGREHPIKTVSVNHPLISTPTLSTFSLVDTHAAGRNFPLKDILTKLRPLEHESL